MTEIGVEFVEPRISFTWPSSVEGTFGINLVDDINRLVRKTKFELVIMAYNLNVSSDFFLQQTIRDRLRMCKPKIKLFCDNFNTASSFADLFSHDPVVNGLMFLSRSRCLRKFSFCLGASITRALSFGLC